MDPSRASLPGRASTEPRPRGRGMRGGGRLHLRGLSASTEPRPRGRGMLDPVVAVALLGVAASTEPRPRGRGMLYPEALRAVLEALQRSPDLAVGEWTRRRQGRRRRRSFNGAPTSRSGNVDQGRAAVDAGAASTEPRPRGRGMPTPGGKVAMDIELQRSPDLAVGECRPGRGRGRDHGYGFNGAPTSRSGNDDGPGECHSAVGRASTEPRPRGRGMRSTLRASGRGAALQRSPDLAVGECTNVQVAQTSDAVLQRSPDLAVGE